MLHSVVLRFMYGMEVKVMARGSILRDIAILGAGLSNPLLFSKNRKVRGWTNLICVSGLLFGIILFCLSVLCVIISISNSGYHYIAHLFNEAAYWTMGIAIGLLITSLAVMIIPGIYDIIKSEFSGAVNDIKGK